MNTKNAEKPKEFYKRINSCIKRLSNSSENILLVSHASVAGMIEIIKTGKDINLFYDIPMCPNTAIIKIDYIK
ncbi:MAG: histidine phosphatase family protein [Patescibacteria group bacterium]